ncbi:MAG TPA: AHH domain-containing protein, partial [Longimicrobium sp.]|nr:AHH domain-containing protein [Longimicrobium sp.]
VAVVGETPVRAMETGFELVRTLVTQGPAAAWQQIVEGISNLRDMVMEQVMSFVRTRIVQAAVTRLVTSLNPAGAFIQAIIAIYNTVMFFIERLRQIAQVAMSFIDSIAAIAAGNIGSAAARVETTMAGLLTLVISFLARLVGLGRVSDAVVNLINRVRQPVFRAMDRVVNWIVTQARRLGRFVAQAGVPQDPAARLRLASQAAVAAARRLRGRITASLLAPVLAGLRVRYGLTEIRPYERRGRWFARIVVNPADDPELGPSTPAAGATPSAAGATPSAAGAPVAWPTAAGRSISVRIGRGRRIQQVRSIDTTANTITFTERGGGSSTSSYAGFMARWNIGDIRPAEESAAELRARLTAKWGAAVADAIMRRDELTRNVGITDDRQAHHIIPVEILGKQEVLRLLVQSGWNFNARINGVPLAEGFHGNHPAYTAYVDRRIDQFMGGYAARPVAEAVAPFRAFLENTLLPELRDHIEEARRRYGSTGRNLNDYFRTL